MGAKGAKAAKAGAKRGATKDVGQQRAGDGAAEPRFFATPSELRAWLAKHHDRQSELLVGLWKKESGKPSITWPELVDECLCYGWIDGVRHGGDESYTIRITPRKPGSVWSAKNIANVERLRAEGRMTPAGEAAFAALKGERSRIYSFEQDVVAFDPAREERFRAQKEAWTWWEAQPPSYRKAATWIVMSAKQEATRDRRLANVMEHAARGERIPQLISPTRKAAAPRARAPPAKAPPRSRATGRGRPSRRS